MNALGLPPARPDRQADWGAPRFIRIANPMPAYGLRIHDYIAVVPVDRWRADAVYVLDMLGYPVPYHCSNDFNGHIRIRGFGEGDEWVPLTYDRFHELLLGQVLAACRVLDASLFEEMSS